MAKLKLVKVAWIRNQGIPPGQPAWGRLACPCGNAPESRYNINQVDVECECGRLYRWDGLLLEQPAEAKD